MLQYDRLIKIKSILKENQSVSTNQLAEALGVSAVTVRKDLDAMERSGIVTRTHGGAALADFSVSSAATRRAAEFGGGIDAVTELAKGYVNPGDFIFLGSGRTCLCLAEKIKNIKNISVITNNVTALIVLKPYVENIVLLGGEVVPSPGGLLATCDSHLEFKSSGLFVNKAFSSGVGIDVEAGLTVNNMLSTYVTRIIPQLADEWYVMMDASKIGIRAFYQAADFSKISSLITDVSDESVLSRYKEKGLKIIHP